MQHPEEEGKNYRYRYDQIRNNLSLLLKMEVFSYLYMFSKTI